MFNPGLVEVPTDVLKKALRHLHRGELDVPLTIVALTRVGLQDRAEPFLQLMRQLDKPGIQAVLTAVLAERDAQARRGG